MAGSSFGWNAGWQNRYGDDISDDESHAVEDLDLNPSNKSRNTEGIEYIWDKQTNKQCRQYPIVIGLFSSMFETYFIPDILGKSLAFENQQK